MYIRHAVTPLLWPDLECNLNCKNFVAVSGKQTDSFQSCYNPTRKVEEHSKRFWGAAVEETALPVTPNHAQTRSAWGPINILGRTNLLHTTSV